MMSEVDCDFEHSPLSGPRHAGWRDSRGRDLSLAGMPECWRIEVVHNSGCIQWDTTFATDADARTAFDAMVDASCIASFTGNRPKMWN